MWEGSTFRWQVFKLLNYTAFCRSFQCDGLCTQNDRKQKLRHQNCEKSCVLYTTKYDHFKNMTILFSSLSCSILWLQRPDWPDPDGSLNDVLPFTRPKPIRQLDRHLSANCCSQIPRPPPDAGAALQPRWQPDGPQCRVLWGQLSVQASPLSPCNELLQCNSQIHI